MNGTSRWIVVLAALLFAGFVGAVAFNAGLAQAGAGVGAAVAYRPWGFGVFVPFFAFAFFIVLIRLLVGRGGYGYRRGCGRFEEWHREMHERMGDGVGGGGSAPR